MPVGKPFPPRPGVGLGIAGMGVMEGIPLPVGRLGRIGVTEPTPERLGVTELMGRPETGGREPVPLRAP